MLMTHVVCLKDAKTGDERHRKPCKQQVGNICYESLKLAQLLWRQSRFICIEIGEAEAALSGGGALSEEVGALRSSHPSLHAPPRHNGARNITRLRGPQFRRRFAAPRPSGCYRALSRAPSLTITRTAKSPTLFDPSLSQSVNFK